MLGAYDPVADGLTQKFFLVVAVLGIIGALVYYANTSNLFGTQAATTINTTASSSFSSLTSGLIGHWTFDGPNLTSATAYDSSGQNKNGTLQNGPKPTAGVSGQALSFDGSNDYVDVGSQDIYNVDPGEIKTFSIWIKNASLPSTRHFYWKEGSCIGWSFYQTITGVISLRFRTSASGCTGFVSYTVSSPVGVNYADGAWHSVVGVIDRAQTTMSLYMDGIFVSSTTIDNTLAANGGTFRIGTQWDNTAPYNGSLDDARVYGRALAADEIYDLYTSGKPNKVNTKESQEDTLTKGLVGYWKFNEGVGSSTADSSGNNNTGTFVNQTFWTTGKIDGAVILDGTNDYINAGGDSSLQTPVFTYAAWVKPTGTTTRTIKSTASNSGPQFRIDTTGTIRLLKANITTIGNSVGTVSNDVWNHVAVSYDSQGNYAYYINGSRSGSGTNLQTFTFSNTYIGSNTGITEFFAGSIDEFRMYNRVLTGEEVTKLYRTTTPSDPESGLVGHWTFDGSDISAATAYDRSGKGNNGTLTSGAKAAAGKLGQAVTFDGVDDYVNLTTNLSTLATTEITVSAWVRSTNPPAGVGRLVATTYDWDATPANVRGWTLGNNYGSTSEFNFFLYDGSGNGTSAWYADFFTNFTNQWKFVTGVFKGGQYTRLYIDGELVAADTTSIPASIGYNPATNLRIGARGDNGTQGNWQGELDDIRVYNRALSVEEIQDLYQKGSGPKTDGFACGKAQVHDDDYNYYDTIQIGTQCWMKQNMRVGTRISGATNQTNNATIEKWCYSNTDSNCTSNNPNVPDGGLYQWDEAMQYSTTPGAQGICPSGWHIPTHDEFTTLERAICTSGTCATDFPYDTTTTGSIGTDEGTKLKPNGTSGLNFNLAGIGLGGSFFTRGSSGYFWSSSETGSNAWYRSVSSTGAYVTRMNLGKSSGFSVRCVKD